MRTKSLTRPKRSAAEQIVAIGLMRQMSKRMRIAPVILDTRGEIPQEYLLRLNDTGKCSLYYAHNQFSTNESMVPQENVDDILGQLDCKTMGHFLALNKIGMSKGSDHQMILRAMMMGRGGMSHKASAWLEWAVGYMIDFATFRAFTKTIEKAPSVVDNLARGWGEYGEALNRVANDQEMIAAGYQQVAPGKWTLVKVLKKLLPESVQNSTVYTSLVSMPEEMRVTTKQLLESQLYTGNNALNSTIQGAVNRVTEVLKPEGTTYFFDKSGVVNKVVETVGNAKQALESTVGGKILSNVAEGALTQGLWGAAIHLGVNIAGNIFYYYYDPSTPVASIVNTTLQEKFTGEGTIVDNYLGTAQTAGLIAAQGFAAYSGKHILKKSVYWGARLIPLPI